MSEAFGDRLRRLRRESAPASSAPARRETARGGGAGSRRGGGIPDWLRARLGRRTAAPTEAPGGPRGAGEPAHLVERDGPRGAHAARELVYAAEHRHGAFSLEEVDALDPATLSLVAGDAALAGFDPRRAVYLDIETTGLSGGAGVYPFLVGLGAFGADGRFHLWQGFLRSPAEEPALLAEAAERIAGADAVVSFFGKSFDRHRLEDKMRIAGVEPPFEGRPHLDLYHPLVGLYRGVFPDGRLATFEAELAGVRRVDDLSGSFAPAAWFDYLAGRGHRLEAVFRHHRDDVLSLVVLAAQLGRSREEQRADGTPLEGCARARAVGLARACERSGDRDGALHWLGLALERSAHAPHEARALRLRRAEHLARAGRAAEARPELAALADGADEHSLNAAVELAKLAEHRLRDLALARSACERALALHASLPTARLPLAELERRRARLESKLARAGGAL